MHNYLSSWLNLHMLTCPAVLCPLSVCVCTCVCVNGPTLQKPCGMPRMPECVRQGPPVYSPVQRRGVHVRCRGELRLHNVRLQVSTRGTEGWRPPPSTALHPSFRSLSLTSVTTPKLEQGEKDNGVKATSTRGCSWLVLCL